MEIDGAALDAAAVDRRLSGVVTIDRDESLYERRAGFANRALAVRTRAGRGSRWPAGARSITAWVFCAWWRAESSSLGDPVRPILGDDLPLIDDAVTIEHLLGHTSGIGDDLFDEEADWQPTDYSLPVPVHTLADTEAFVPVVDGFAQASEPGERFSYNNRGYIVLAVIIDRLSDVGYHAYMEREVCGRAG